uniref:Xyloglucan:xyloglucosyl transferase, putative / xyloglucan endotransglycosylase, putative / endo-xyloglucan transferase, putative n=1 Tax=Arundo donax TaxID=35708 RepID=A0A0A9D9S4_ARUDO
MPTNPCFPPSTPRHRTWIRCTLPIQILQALCTRHCSSSSFCEATIRNLLVIRSKSWPRLHSTKMSPISDDSCRYVLVIRSTVPDSLRADSCRVLDGVCLCAGSSWTRCRSGCTRTRPASRAATASSRPPSPCTSSPASGTPTTGRHAAGSRRRTGQRAPSSPPTATSPPTPAPGRPPTTRPRRRRRARRPRAAAAGGTSPPRGRWTTRSGRTPPGWAATSSSTTTAPTASGSPRRPRSARSGPPPPPRES